MIEQLIAGFGAAITAENLLFIAAGITLGIVIGVIPGLGSVTALAVLIPVTYYMSPLAAIAFLVGVNKGGTSGGAVPAILLNSPGTPESAATALDGHPMARRGESLRALKFALYSSVTGDTISDVLLILLVVPFAAIADPFNCSFQTGANHPCVLSCAIDVPPGSPNDGVWLVEAIIPALWQPFAGAACALKT